MHDSLKSYACVALLFISFPGISQNLYVSSKGTNEGAGSIAEPFATLQRALDEVESIKSNENNEVDTIFLREGVYHIPHTLKLDAAYSNLVIQAFHGEKVIFSGGLSIPDIHVEEVEVPGIRTIPTAKLYKINLKEAGIDNYGKLRNVGFSRPYGVAWGELFVNKKPFHLSRWPNKGMIPMGRILDKGSVPREGDFSNRGGVMKYDSSRISGWAKEKNVWMSGYFMWGYADDMVKIEAIDTEKLTITTASPTLYGYGYDKPYRKWYGVNILAELDDAGEYYVDHEKGHLFFISEASEIESLEFSILEEPFIEIEGAENLSISGITFECSRGIGIAMSNTTRITIKGCTFRNLGSLGITVGKGIEPFDTYQHAATGKAKAGIIGSLQQHLYENTTFNREAGRENTIIGCQFYQLGAGGVSLGGGDRLSLEKGNNRVENCLFHDLNRIEKSYRPAVELTGVGNRIIHCEIYNTPSMAILMHGNDHLLEFNYIHDVCLEVEDQGAFYYGRDPSERGTVVRYNYFENIPDHFSTCAIYNDDGACGLMVHGNVFYKAGKRNVLLGGGSDNSYTNNIFIGTEYGIHVDNRLQNWAKSSLDKDGIFEKRLNAVNFQKPPYSVHYPELPAYFKKADLPKRNLVENNVFLRVGKLLDGKKEWLDYRDSNWLTDQDVLFADPENKNFSLSPESDIYKVLPNFKEIPFHTIGLYESGDFPCIRLRNGMHTAVNDVNRKEWLKKQDRIKAYTVTDKAVTEIIDRLKNDHQKAVFPNPNEGAQWFSEGNFGLFMHWGPHSTQGAQPSWAMIKNYPYGYEDKYSNPEDYFALAQDFDPQSWNPDAICKAASEAGMSYVVLTTKHHDGYALWPSKYGNYNIGIFHPGMDLLKPYVAACRKYGLKVGFYFSQRDWSFPDYPVGDQNFNYRTRGKYPLLDEELNDERYQRWLAFSLGQLSELLSSYGQIDLLWFDGFSWPEKQQEHYTDALFNWIRMLQPGIVVNDRWYKMRSPDADRESIGKGDFATVEWSEPDEGIDKWWEFTTSWCGSWGYSELRFDDKEALKNLVLARSLGGNFLLNIGPSGDGLPPKGFFNYMENLALWITPHKEALFGKEIKAGDPSLSNIKTTKKKNTLYLHVLPGMKDDIIVLDGKLSIGRMENLGSGNAVNFKRSKGQYIISRKKNKLGAEAYHVIAIELKNL